MRPFKFFQKFIPYQLEISFPHRRYPRIPIDNIPYPTNYTEIEERAIFRRGWRACEQGNQIYDNPYSRYDQLEYSSYNAWEIGWLECYHNHPSRIHPTEIMQPTDEDCYLNGWDSARSGRPNHDNPYNNVNLNGWINTDLITHYKTMWDLGWNDFINDH